MPIRYPEVGISVIPQTWYSPGYLQDEIFRTREDEEEDSYTRACLLLMIPAHHPFGKDLINLPTSLLIAPSYFQPPSAANSGPFNGSAVVTIIMSSSSIKIM